MKFDNGVNLAKAMENLSKLGEISKIQCNRKIYRMSNSKARVAINRYAGVNPANGDALWYTKDGEITNVFSEGDKVMPRK